MLMLWALALAFTSPSFALSPAFTGYFGPDLRVHAYQDSFDAAVQRLDLESGWCTAFLIAPQFAITAGHCTREKTLRLSLDQGGSFLPGTPVDASYTSPGFAMVPDLDGDLYPREDWGLVHLSTASQLPTLEMAGPEDLIIGASALAIGYPGPTYAGQWRVQDSHCTIRGFEDDSILTDCATSTGNSGGPLLVMTKNGQWKVAGVCSTEFVDGMGRTIQGETYRDANANRFANITTHASEIRAATAGPTVFFERRPAVIR
jgi:hypothetical protein